MKLECYALVPHPPRLAAADGQRDWMDDSPERFAYGCQPLNMANHWGWELRSPVRFSIHWNGGPDTADLTLSCADDYPLEQLAVSHFGQGIVSFHTGYLFRTAERWNMLASAPLNRPKDGIYALSGMVETHWLPIPFTINWVMTRAGTVTFEQDEPIALLVPLIEGQLDGIQPGIHDLAGNPELLRQYENWRSHRAGYLARLQAGDVGLLQTTCPGHPSPDGNSAAVPADAPPSATCPRLADPVDRRPCRNPLTRKDRS